MSDYDGYDPVAARRIAALRAEIERKDAALRRYGQHSDDCDARGCVCGLDAALSSGEGEEESGTSGSSAADGDAVPHSSSPTLSREAAERIERKLCFGTFSTQEDVIQAILDAAQEESRGA